MAPPAERLRLAYLLSQYPTIHHTFLLREVRRIRACGGDVRVASVSSPDRNSRDLSAEEREEYDQTFYIKAVGWAGAAGVHARWLLTRPAGYLRGLGRALSLAGPDGRALFSHVLYFAEAVVAADWMEREGLTHLHTHFSSTVALLTQQVRPCKLSLTIHGPDEFNDVEAFHLAEKVRAAAQVIAISQYARSQILRWCSPEYWPRVEVIALGIDPDIYEPRPFREAPAVFEVISVGRLAGVKGQALLIEALGQLRQQNRSVRLRLVGDGPERRPLEALTKRLGLAEHVVFEGWRDQQEVRQLYAQADLFALASFAEGVPVVLMEAMAMEIPCVAPRITGIPELIRDGVDGLLVAPASACELAQAIAALIDDPARRRRLGSSGREQVLRHYDLARNTAKLYEALRSL